MSFATRPKTSLAFARNIHPILEVLGPHLAPGARVLEVGSGPGQHVASFASAHPNVRWQPSEANPALLEEIEAWSQGAENIEVPLLLDLLAPQEGWWQAFEPGSVDMIVSINVAHIAPWEATKRLVQGAALLLRPGGELYFYGPWRRQGVALEPSNQEFDQRLRQGQASSGIRVLEELEAEASLHGLVLDKEVAMPANNRSLFLQKR